MNKSRAIVKASRIISNVTVWTKPVCQGCRGVKIKLDKLEIEYETKELDQDTADKFRALDLGAAPVVEVDFGEGAVWRWAGYAPTKIETLDHIYSCDDPECSRCESIPLAA